MAKLLLPVLLVFVASCLASASQSSPAPPSTAQQPSSTNDANQSNAPEEARVQPKARVTFDDQPVSLQSEIDRTNERIHGLLRDIDSMVRAKYYGELEVQRLKEKQVAAQIQVQEVGVKEAMQ